jgi:hypothetical protein
MVRGITEPINTRIKKNEGCRKFATDTEMKCGSKEQRRVEAQDLGGYGLKMSRSAIVEEDLFYQFIVPTKCTVFILFSPCIFRV